MMTLKICKECLPFYPFEARVKEIVSPDKCSVHFGDVTDETDDEVEHVTPDNATRIF